MISHSFTSVWHAITDDPVEQVNLKMRADLMLHISDIVQENGWTQTEAAKHCGITQPRLNYLLKGDFNKFSLDALIKINAKLGQNIHLTFEPAEA